MVFSRARRAAILVKPREDYMPGDLVTWDLGGASHIGVVVDSKSSQAGRYMIVQTSAGPRMEDVLS